MTFVEWDTCVAAPTIGALAVACDRRSRSLGSILRMSSCRGCRAKAASPIASLKPSAFGPYDMHGNVGERVEDCNQESDLELPSAWSSAVRVHSVHYWTECAYAPACGFGTPSEASALRIPLCAPPFIWLRIPWLPVGESAKSMICCREARRWDSSTSAPKTKAADALPSF
jgi:hypothetical protein